MSTKAGKRKKTTSTSSTRGYDARRFLFVGRQQRFESYPIKPSFVKERALALASGDFEDMQLTIRERGWQSLVSYPKDESR